jgi:amino acid adenylation domain-containing protein
MPLDGASVTSGTDDDPGRGASSLAGLLRERAGNRPDRLVYAYSADGTDPSQADDGCTLTLGTLDARARTLAAWMRERELEGERVLLVFPPGLEFVSAFFGCLYAGAVAVPASTPRPNRPMTRLRAIVDDARPAALLTTAALLPAARQWREAIPTLDAIHCLDVESVPESLAASWRDPGPSLDALAFLQYTSGSTATPKGVMVTHGNLVHNSAVIRRSFGAGEESRGVFWLPLFHDMGLIGGVLQTLYCGGFSTLMSPVAFLQRPVRWLEAISRTGATISGGPNFAYDLCARKVTDAQKASLDLSRWTVAFNGAEPVRAETLDRFADAFAPCGFRREAFLPCYGLAESTLMVTGKRAEEPPRVVSFRGADLERDRAVATVEGEPGARRLVSGGRAFDDLRVEVVDPETATVCSEDQVGEIRVSGPSVAAGYWNRPEATAETFGARLAGGDGPFLRTGDLGFLSAGELYVTGRLKDLLIVRGRNVYPQDVEWSAAAAHPLARAEGSATFSVEADGEERLVVVQEVERLGKGVEPEEVIRAIRTAVAEEHDLDVHDVCLIRALSLPKTSSGKVKRHACREAYLDGSLDTIARSTPPRLAPARPASEVERWLVDRLASTLAIDPAGVDLRRPFASFGLGSLQAVRLAGELEEWLGRRLSPTLIYEYPTIESLGRHLAGEGLAGARATSERVETPAEPIAIVGIGCRFPGADGPEAFWRLLSEGIDAVGAPPEGRVGTAPGGFLEGVDLFDADFFGIAPREAVNADPQHRLLLEVAWRALEDAGLAPDRLRGQDVGVFVGVSNNDYGRGRLGVAKEAYSVTGNALSVAANRISYAFDFRGPSLAVDTACSSSLVALHLACESLRRGEASLALAGGVNLILDEEITETFAAAGFLSPVGRCKAFDASADGYVRGEGAGVVLLKPLARALADGDPVHAVILGSAVNQDGRSNGLTAPNRDAQEAVLRAAYRRAGVAPGSVDYVEAHGTGTLLGDPIEAAALGAVVGDDRPADRPCLVGSVKTNIGHLESAAGIAGVIKVALALGRRAIPPSLHFREPNPHIRFESLPIRVQTALEDWPERDRPRLAGVSSFGFGGTNAHMVLEAPPRPVFTSAAREVGPSLDEPEVCLIPISARHPEALRELARSFRDFLGGEDAPPLADVARAAAVRRGHHEHRLAIGARTRAEAVARLDAYLRGAPVAGVAEGRRPPSRRPRCVFVFSGQGSQWWGMGRGLASAEPVFRAALESCDQRLQPILGWSVVEELAVVEERSRLDQTGFAQPVVFAVQVALTALWRSWGIVPDAVVGHSLGEAAAAHAAGALGLDDAARVVAHRARLMQTTVGRGLTAAVALPEDEAARLIANDPERLALACVNGPAASVVSGDAEAILTLVQSLRGRGGFAKVLSGRCPFHSPRMDPLLDDLRGALEGIAPGKSAVPIVSTVTGGLIEGERLDPGYWARNLRDTVRFADAIAALSDGSYDVFLEVGPHPALGPALGDTLKSMGRSATVLASLRRGDDGRDVLLGSLGNLYALGFPVAWDHLATAGRFCTLPGYPFQRERFWLDVSDEPARRVHTNGVHRNGFAHAHAIEPPSASTGFCEIEWQPRERTARRSGDSQGTRVVFEDAGGVGAALRARLEARGGRCIAVAHSETFERIDGSHYRINPLRLVDYRRLIDEASTAGPLAGLVHLWSLDAAVSRGMSLADLAEAQRLGCGSLVPLVQALDGSTVAGRGSAAPPRFWVATAGAQPAGDDDGPLAVAQAPVWGLGRSIALERPALWGGLVDLDPADPIACTDALLEEILDGSGEDQAAYRGGRRFVPRLVARQRAEGLAGALPVRADGTYLVTGGLGALGLRVAHRLVEQGARRVVLVGRRGLPDRAEWEASNDPRVAAARAMEQLGATVYAAAADVSDPAAMAALFADLRRLFPPLRGVVHAAGVATPLGLGALDGESLAEGLRPKVAGAWILHELSRDLPLDFFVAFSSLASVLGAKEAHYAAGNAFLDALAHHRRKLGLTALSVNWGPWEGAGMASEGEHARVFAILGVRPLRLDDGFDALTSLVAAGVSQAVVADADWDALGALHGSDGRRHLLDLVHERDGSKDQAPPVENGHGPAWRDGSADESRARLVELLRVRLAAVLKLDPARVDPARPLDTMGLDSLMAIELRNGVESDLGASLPLASLLRGPTLEQLATRVLDEWSANGEAEASPSPMVALAEVDEPETDAPLSVGQRALWSFHQISPESPAYNMVGAVRIAGPLDPDALRRAAQRLVDRHASLRTTFPSEHGEPIQRVHRRREVAFRFEDVAGASQASLTRRLTRGANRPFDLENGPLFRIHLYRRSASEHALLLAAHHIVGDFWSIAVLLDELGRAYPAELAGGEADLPDLPLSYTDFVRWQTAMIDGAAGARHRDYWLAKLAGPLPVLALPTDRPRPPSQTFRGAATLVRLPSRLTAGLSALARRRGASLYMTLLAAFQVLLSRYSGQEDVIVGSPVAGRNRPGLDGVVGYFVNTLPLRSRVAPGLSFAAFLDEVRDTVVEGLEHQDFPFALLADRVQTVRDPSHSPVFQVMFVLQKAQRLDDKGFSSFVLRGSGPRMELGGFPVESIALDVPGAQFDLPVQIAEDGDRLAVSAEYNTDLFDAGTIDRLLGHYRTLLEAVVADSDAPLAALPMLTRAEQRRLARWNATDAPFPADVCFPQLFEAQVDRTPDAIAVAAADGSLSYRELNARANRLAHRLRELGVAPDARVGICVERSTAMLVGILGVLKAGAGYVPLDPEYPADRLAFMIDDSRASVLLSESRLRSSFPARGVRVVCLDGDEFAGQGVENPEPVASPESLAYMIYTSGSTGRPKGVLVTHRNLVHSTHARLLHYKEPVAAYLLVSSFAFDSSVAGLFWTLSQGGTLVLPAGGEQGDPTALAVLITRHRVSHILSVPSLYALILEHAPAESLASLRTAIVAGEPCPRDLPARHHGVLPAASLHNEYGPTEATVWATAHRCSPADSDSGRGPIPIGRPIANTRAYVLDARMRPVPVGVTGELCLGGAGVARGYHGQPALTAERFLADPFSNVPGARLYRTGDLARFRPDGVIEFLGRLDDQVKIRGYRIELGEVESALSSHPDVREAAASVLRGETGDSRLVGYVVPRAGAALTVGGLRSWLKSRLPDAMVPSAFATLDALPLSPNGKVDRAALPDPALSPVPSAPTSEEPATAVEETLARLAAGLLKVGRVGVHDDFFALGLDSILAIQLVARARKAGLRLTPAQLFQSPTVARLAAVAVVETTGETPALAPVDFPLARLDSAAIARLAKPGLAIEDVYPLTPVQEGMLFHSRHSAGAGEYVQQLASVVRGTLDLAAFEQAWRGLVDRHAVLRTAFHWIDAGRPVQAVYRGIALPWEVVDWRETGMVEREQRLDDFLRLDRARGFDPSTPPLMRLTLFRIEDDVWQLVWTYHHLLIDGWCLQIVLQELLALYEGNVSGRPVDLPGRPPFRDYIAWLEARDQGLTEAYWRETLKGLRAATPLGVDRSDDDLTEGSEPYDEQEARLPEESTSALVALGRRHGLTLNTLVQGAWALILGRYSGRDDVVFGATVSGRSAPIDGVEAIVGLLINTLPVRVSIDGRERLLPWLSRLQERFTAMREHEAAPLVMVQGWSEVPRGRPLFESLLVFENYPADASLGDRAGGLGFGSVRVMERTSFPLTLMVFPGASLVVRATYDSRRFDAQAIDRLLGHLTCVLAGIAADPDRVLDALPLASTDDMRQVLNQWNGDQADRLDLDGLSDDDVEALIGKYFETEEVSDE